MVNKTSSHKQNSARVASKRGLRSRGNSTKQPSSPRSPGLREQLEQVAHGLFHVSEADYPYRFFSLPSESEKDLSAQGFLIRLGVSQQFTDEFNVPTDKLVSEMALEDFFPTIDVLADYYGSGKSDPKVVSVWKRYQKLEALLKKHLRGVRVIRVGSVEVRSYIAGLDKDGNIAGLLTTCIET